MKAACSFILLFFFYYTDAQNNIASQESAAVLIGQCMQGTAVHARLAYEVNDNDTSYVLSLHNLQNDTTNSYHSLMFSGNATTVNQFYSILKLMIAKRNKKHKDYSTTIALGNKLVVIATTRILGETSAVVYLPEGYNYLTERQVDKVFGKM